METVTTDGVVLVVLIRNGVNVRFRRHGHAEGGVEHATCGTPWARSPGHALMPMRLAVAQRPEREALLMAASHVVPRR